MAGDRRFAAHHCVHSPSDLRLSAAAAPIPFVQTRMIALVQPDGNSVRLGRLVVEMRGRPPVLRCQSCCGRRTAESSLSTSGGYLSALRWTEL